MEPLEGGTQRTPPCLLLLARLCHVKRPTALHYYFSKSIRAALTLDI